jgi:hypothetical protein
VSERYRAARGPASGAIRGTTGQRGSGAECQ